LPLTRLEAESVQCSLRCVFVDFVLPGNLRNAVTCHQLNTAKLKEQLSSHLEQVGRGSVNAERWDVLRTRGGWRVRTIS
jgi:hypothetical protein